MYCSYCNGLGHKITECDKDLHLKDIIYADVEPDFRVMQHRVLKRIASLHDIKTSLPRIQIICKLRKIWRDYNSEEEHIEAEHIEAEHFEAEHIEAEHIEEDDDECPICYNVLGDRGKTITDCGHEFCTQCFIRHSRSHNSCPMCRQDLLIHEQDFIPFMNGPHMQDLHMQDLHVHAGQMQDGVAMQYGVQMQDGVAMQDVQHDLNMQENNMNVPALNHEDIVELLIMMQNNFNNENIIQEELLNFNNNMIHDFDNNNNLINNNFNNINNNNDNINNNNNVNNMINNINNNMYNVVG